MDNQKKLVIIKNIVGVILILPLTILVFSYILKPLASNIYNSFRYFDFFNSTFIGISNYSLILKDDMTKMIIKNTFVITLVSTLIVVLLSFLLAWLSSRLKKSLRYILITIFLIISITYLIPTGLSRIFYDFSYYQSEGILRLNPNLNFIMSLIIPSLIGLGPLYLLFSIAFERKQTLVKYLHIGILLQIVLCFISYRSLARVINNYLNVTLLTQIEDFYFFRFQAGFASALLVVLGMVMLFSIVILNGLLILITHYLKTKKELFIKTESKQKLTMQVIVFVLILSLQSILLYPFIEMIIDSFTPINQIVLHGFVGFTFDNYHKTFNELILSRYSFELAFFHTIETLIFSSLFIYLIAIISSFGLLLISRKAKKFIQICLVSLTLVTPFIIITTDLFTQRNQIVNIFIASTRSVTFGLCIFISSVILKSYLEKFTNSKNIKYLFYGMGKILSLSILSFIPLCFNEYLSNGREYYAILINTVTASHMELAVNSCVTVICLSLPILLVAVFTPMLLKCFIKD